MCPVEVGTGTIYIDVGEKGSFKKYTIVKDHPHSKCNVITLAECDSRTKAEELRNSGIYIEKKELPELEEGEYYSYQLIGIKVKTTDGEYLGDIAEILSTGSNDVYVVRDGEKEILIPAIEDVIEEIDLEGKIIRVKLIEGLR